jgi:YD repeat-containing protein
LFDGATCLAVGRNPLVQLTDENGVVYVADGIQGFIQTVTKPEGDQIQYTWDGDANLTQEKHVAKPGSPLQPTTQSANYNWAGCTPVNCNEPSWVKDALQNETDYTYDPTHGGVVTKTLPADANGFRPQTTYTYTPLHAWVLNSSGTFVQSAAPIYVLLTETICRTGKTNPTGSTTPCALAGDQVVKTYQYGPNSGPNNLFVRGVSVAADGATHTTCYGYDIYGNRTSETEPLAGLTTCP